MLYKIPPFSRVAKCQKSVKSHLFQETENAIILGGYYYTKMLPQISNLTIVESNEPKILTKK
jgi:hypothetical protein